MWSEVQDSEGRSDRSSINLDDQVRVFIMEELDLADVVARGRELFCPTATDAQLAEAEFDYRRFLWVHRQYPDADLTPSEAVDMIWHAHILFTRRYFDDCEHMFGHYLHHTPGKGSGISKAEFKRRFRATKDLYEREFGERPRGNLDLCGGGRCPSDCSSGSCSCS